jgi:dTDP-glucose pyrophosphorylase
MSNWKNILISRKATIEESLIAINKEPYQMAMVVNEENELLGIITNGDIRRALINKITLNANVSEIMCLNPTVVDVSASDTDVLKIMTDKSLSAIPVLSNGIVIGLKTLLNLLGKKKRDNPVFIMAGGFGSRLRPLTDNCPKPMLHVGDKPILETLILQFKNAGFHNFYISTHYLPEVIHNHFGDGSSFDISIEYVHETTPLGTGGALGLLPPDMNDLPVLVINGDILTKIDFNALLNFHNSNNSLATMCVREYEYQIPFGVVETDNENNIKSMVEKPTHRYKVNAGIYVIGQALIKKIIKNEYLDMPNLFANNIKLNVLAYPFYDYWLDIGRMDDFDRAQNDILLFK